MTNANDPTTTVVDVKLGQIIYDGLTKREHFAAMAMQGMCANQMLADVDHSQLAIEALRSADALIEALNKTQY